MKVIQEAEVLRRPGTTEALCLEPLNTDSSRTENGGRRHVPGAPNGSPAQGQNRKKGRRMAIVKFLGRGEDGGQTVDGVSGRGRTPRAEEQWTKGNRGKRQLPQSNDEGRGTPPLQLPPAPITADPELPMSPGADNTLDPIAKKARNLNKKVGISRLFLFLPC